jgi:hypothetical protein
MLEIIIGMVKGETRFGPLVQVGGVLALEGGQAADAAADHHAEAAGIDGGNVEAGVFIAILEAATASCT